MTDFLPELEDRSPVCPHCGRTGAKPRDDGKLRCGTCNAAFASGDRYPCVAKCCRKEAEPVLFPRYTSDVFLDGGE